MSTPGASLITLSPHVANIPIVAQSGGSQEPSLLNSQISIADKMIPIVEQSGGASKSILIFGIPRTIRSPEDRRPPNKSPMPIDDSEKAALKDWGFGEIQLSNNELVHNFLDNLFEGKCLSDGVIGAFSQCAPTHTLLSQLAQSILNMAQTPIEIKSIVTSDGKIIPVTPTTPINLQTDSISKVKFECVSTPSSSSTSSSSTKYCLSPTNHEAMLLGSALYKFIENGNVDLYDITTRKDLWTPGSNSRTSAQIITKFNELDKTILELTIQDIYVIYLNLLSKSKQNKNAIQTQKDAIDWQFSEFMDILYILTDKAANLYKPEFNEIPPDNDIPDDFKWNPILIDVTDPVKKKEAQAKLAELFTKLNINDFTHIIKKVIKENISKDSKPVPNDKINKFIKKIDNYIKQDVTNKQLTQLTTAINARENEQGAFNQLITDYNNSGPFLINQFPNVPTGPIIINSIGHNISPLSASLKDFSYVSALALGHPLPPTTPDSQSFINITDQAKASILVWLFTRLIQDYNANKDKYKADAGTKNFDGIRKKIFENANEPGDTNQIIDSNVDAVMKALIAYMKEKGIFHDTDIDNFSDTEENNNAGTTPKRSPGVPPKPVTLASIAPSNAGTTPKRSPGVPPKPLNNNQSNANTISGTYKGIKIKGNIDLWKDVIDEAAKDSENLEKLKQLLNDYDILEEKRKTASPQDLKKTLTPSLGKKTVEIENFINTFRPLTNSDKINLALFKKYGGGTLSRTRKVRFNKHKHYFNPISLLKTSQKTKRRSFSYK